MKKDSEKISCELDRIGFSQFTAIDGTVLWTLGNSDVSPFFIPVILRKKRESALIGSIGVVIKSFERDWALYCEKLKIKKKYLGIPPLNKTTSNFFFFDE